MENKTWIIKYRTDGTYFKKILLKMLGLIIIISICLLLIVSLVVNNFNIDKLFILISFAFFASILTHENSLMVDQEHGVWLSYNNENFIKWKNIASIEYDNKLKITIINEGFNEPTQIVLIPIGRKSKQASMEVHDYFYSARTKLNL